MNARILSSPKDSREQLAADIDSPLRLPIRDVTPFTTIDFPGRLAAVLYTQGCAWRCRYCYNSDFWPFNTDARLISWEFIQSFLEGRKGLLDGVVFCGGEPTAHPELGQAMALVKEMGFQIGLHTSGMFPERLQKILGSCDWIGMDVKAPFEDYERVTQVKNSGAGPRRSAQLILESGIEYEFRTTFHPALLSEENILEIAKDLSLLGARHFALQTFYPKGCLDQSLKTYPVSPSFISPSLKNSLHQLLGSVLFR